jgi:hypothetical protein
MDGGYLEVQQVLDWVLCRVLSVEERGELFAVPLEGYGF